MNFQTFILWWSLAWATAAAALNSVAAFRALPTWRPWHGAAAILAWVYVLGFCWLMFTAVDRATWSETLVYVGAIVWPVIWTTPPLLSRATVKALRNHRYDELPDV